MNNKAKKGRPKGTGQYGTKLQVRIPEDEHAKLKDISEVTGLGISETVRSLVKDYISKFDIHKF